MRRARSAATTRRANQAPTPSTTASTTDWASKPIPTPAAARTMAEGETAARATARRISAGEAGWRAGRRHRVPVRLGYLREHDGQGTAVVCADGLSAALEQLGQRARAASLALATASTAAKDAALVAAADLLEARTRSGPGGQRGRRGRRRTGGRARPPRWTGSG